MHKDLIVAIFVPTLATSETPGSQHPGSIGTGYPVADDLVLTARHVLQPERRDPGAKIRVCWYFAHGDHGSCASGDCWQTLDDSALVWEGAGDLDAALIRCPVPEALRRYPRGRLAETLPQQDGRWVSAGFARADRRNAVREPGNFGGLVRSMADKAAVFVVVEDAQPGHEQDWQGVSGMPVFVGGTILGIVEQVPLNYRNKNLEVVPSFRLLEDQRFRDLLGLDEVASHHWAAPRHPISTRWCSSVRSRTHSDACWFCWDVGNLGLSS